MKPRIRLRRGVWVCSLKVGVYTVPPMGHGDTPWEAYAEWRHLAALAGGML